MFRDLPRGMTEVISDSVVLDARGVALLAEQGVGGVKEGHSVTLSVSVDRQSKPKAAMLGVSEGDADTITLDQARSLVTSELSFGNAQIDQLGWLASEVGLIDEDRTIALLQDSADADDQHVDHELDVLQASPVKEISPKRGVNAGKAAGKAKKSKGTEVTKVTAAKLFAVSKAVSSELVELLASAGLEGHETALGAASITSVRALRLHSVDELEQSLRRPTSKGGKFRLSVESAVHSSPWA